MAEETVGYRFQQFGARDVAQSVAEINAQMRAGIGIARQYHQAVGRRPASGIGGRTAGAGPSPAAGQRRQEEAAANAARRAHEKAENDKTRATKREADKRARIEEANAKYLMRVRTNTMLKQQRDQERAEKQHARDMVRVQREALSRERRLANEQQRDMRSAGLGMFAGGVAGVAALGVGAGLGVARAVGGGLVDLGGAAARRRIGLQEQAGRLAINARQHGQKAANAGELMGEAEVAARGVRGSKAEDIMTAQSKFVSATGDLATARKMARTFATMQLATGADAESIGSTAATLREKFGITDEKEMQAAMAKLTFQGKTGAFEFSDMGAHFSEMGAAGSRFGLDKGAGGVATLGALAQIAKMTAGSGAKASTGVQAMLRQLTAKGASGPNGKKSEIEALTGAKVFSDKGNTKGRDVKDVLVDVIAGAKGDMGKLQTIFGEEGMVGASKFITTFNEASNALGKGATEAEKRAAGEAALRKLINDNVNAAGDWAGVVQDATAAGDTFTSKWTSFSEQVLSAMGTAVAPGIAAFTKHLGLAVGPLTEMAKSAGLFMTSIGEVVTYLQRKGIIGTGEGAQMSTSRAAIQLAKNDAELKSLDATEKKFGTLTADQGHRRVMLKAEEAQLIQAMAPAIEDEYGNYKKALGTMVGPGGKPLGATPMGISEFARQTKYFQDAAAYAPQEQRQENLAPVASWINERSGFGRFLSSAGGLNVLGGGVDAMVADNRRGRGATFTDGGGGGVDKLDGASSKTAGTLATFNTNAQAAAEAMAALAKQKPGIGPPGAAGSP